jgi:nucleoside phosphorylase
MSDRAELLALKQLLMLEALELSAIPDRSDIWSLLWCDFKHRLARAEASGSIDHAEYVSEVAFNVLTRLSAEKLVKSAELETLRGRLISPRRYDALIVTPLEVEQTAVQAAIEALLGSAPKPFGHRGIDIREWDFRSRDGRSRRLGLCKVGRARNIPMAIHCNLLFRDFNVSLPILIGMSGGRQAEVELGHVVAASSVLDYEGGTAMLDSDGREKVLPDYQLENVKPPFIGWIEGLEYELGTLDNARQNAIAKLHDLGFTIPPTAANPFRFHFGLIATGDTVRRDSVKMEQLASHVSRKLYAVEMEALGFLSACEGAGLRWAIFRGIADYGDINKTKDWQPVASLNAGLVAMTWLLRRVDFSELPVAIN